MVTNDMNTFAYHGREVEILEMNTAVVWCQVETFGLPTNCQGAPTVTILLKIAHQLFNLTSFGNSTILA